MHPSNEYQRVYVWEEPIRWFHGINALCILVLGATGYLIGHPPGLLSAREAAGSFWFGEIRFIHFLTAYLLVANFVMRLYWSFAGNKYASWRNFVPLRRAQWREMGEVLLVDILQIRERPVAALGHNAVAYLTYAGTGILTIFQVVTGFALYAPMSRSWAGRGFGWVMPLFGSEETLRIFHYAGLWCFAVFVVIHVYLVFYHDYVEGHGVLSSIVGGWKFVERPKAGAPEATGISGGRPRRAVPAAPAAPVAPAAGPPPAAAS